MTSRLSQHSRKQHRGIDRGVNSSGANKRAAPMSTLPDSIDAWLSGAENACCRIGIAYIRTPRHTPRLESGMLMREEPKATYTRGGQCVIPNHRRLFSHSRAAIGAYEGRAVRLPTCVDKACAIAFPGCIGACVQGRKMRYCRCGLASHSHSPMWWACVCI